MCSVRVALVSFCCKLRRMPTAKTAPQAIPKTPKKKRKPKRELSYLIRHVKVGSHDIDLWNEGNTWVLCIRGPEVHGQLVLFDEYLAGVTFAVFAQAADEAAVAKKFGLPASLVGLAVDLPKEKRKWRRERALALKAKGRKGSQ